MRFSFLLPLVALLFSGCAGYKIGPIQPKFMEGIRTIAVPSFKNDTLEPRVEVALANAVIKQFQQDGTSQIADESGRCHRRRHARAHHAPSVALGAWQRARHA